MDPILLDPILLFVAAVVGLGYAFATPTLNRARLLTPINPEDPLSLAKGHKVRFQFVTFGALSDGTKYRPRVLLGWVLTVLIALLLKLFIDPGSEWTYLLIGLAIYTGVVAFVFCGVTNSLAVAMLAGVPPALGVWLSGEVDWLTWLGEMKVVGLVAGGVVGAYAGMFISMNYRSLLYKRKLELKRGETIDQKPIGAYGRFSRRLYVLVLRWLPLVMLYQVVNFWWTDIELSHVASEIGFGGGSALLDLSRHALTFIALGLGLNVVLFTVPLFREMLEHTNHDAAADFGKAAKKYHEKVETKPDAAKNAVEDYLSKSGKWLMFQTEQMFSMLVVGLVLGINAFGQSIEKALNAGLVVPTTTLDGGWGLGEVAIVLAGATWASQVFFLIGWVASWKTATGEIDDAAYFNVRTLWRALREPDFVVTCEEDGGDAKLEVAPPIKVSPISETEPEPATEIPVGVAATPIAPVVHAAAVTPVAPVAPATPVSPATPVVPAVPVRPQSSPVAPVQPQNLYRPHDANRPTPRPRQPGPAPQRRPRPPQPPAPPRR